MKPYRVQLITEVFGPNGSKSQSSIIVFAKSSYDAITKAAKDPSFGSRFDKMDDDAPLKMELQCSPETRAFQVSAD